MVLLQLGNPLSFHSEHRLKTCEGLSCLINPSSFRLDGKKLSSSEKKAVPRSLTACPPSSSSLSTGTPSQSPLHNHHTLTPPPSSQLMSSNSPAHHHSDAVASSKVSNEAYKMDMQSMLAVRRVYTGVTVFIHDCTCTYVKDRETIFIKNTGREKVTEKQ